MVGKGDSARMGQQGRISCHAKGQDEQQRQSADARDFAGLEFHSDRLGRSWRNLVLAKPESETCSSGIDKLKGIPTLLRPGQYQQERRQKRTVSAPFPEAECNLHIGKRSSKVEFSQVALVGSKSLPVIPARKTL
jgi:ribosomal protein L34E